MTDEAARTASSALAAPCRARAVLPQNVHASPKQVVPIDRFPEMPLKCLSVARHLSCGAFHHPQMASIVTLKYREISLMSQEFHDQLVSFLPKMRVWALALTRNRAAADDLTKDVATKALVAQDGFTPGTNFSAWAHRMMVNHFVSGIRNRREFCDWRTYQRWRSRRRTRTVSHCVS